MASTQPPYYSSTFGNPEQDANSSTPTGTTVGSSTVYSPDATGAKAAHGSSTGAPGAPGVRDTRSHYDPNRTEYNPATGSGYTSKNHDKQDSRAEYAPSTTNKEYGAEEVPAEAKSARKGDEIGRGIKLLDRVRGSLSAGH